MVPAKQTAKTLLSWLLTLAVLTSLLAIPLGAVSPAVISFSNSGQGADIISLTDQRSFEALVPGVAADPAAVSWTLTREKGDQDPAIFPYQYLGGPLDSWKKWDSEEPFFLDIKTEKTDSGLKLTFSTDYFFGVNRMDSPRGNRNVILDYTGDYILACLDAGGKVLGQKTLRVAPYDDYKTAAELAASLLEAQAFADTLSNVYMDVQSLGKSTQGYDIPYAVISDSAQSVKDYLALTAKAVKDPEAVLADLTAGKLDYKIPVMLTNIHADETPGADAPMNMIWDVLKAVADAEGKITYQIVTGFTADGEAQMKKEMEAQGIHWSELIAEHVTGLGFIKGENTTSGPVDLEKYYTMEAYTLDVNQLLDQVILLVFPTENVDGRTSDIRQNGNGFDINRDNMFQTQVETQLMTQFIAKWNPATLVELHGFVSGYQVEPCSPPHEPNFEYDLFAENGLKSGEAFGIGAIANNEEYNSYVMPLRDYLVSDEQGNPYWAEPWDDMSTNYTPQYSMLHGTVAFTIEVPKANQAATTSLEYGLLHHMAYVMENKDSFFKNMLTGWVRGVNNIDAPEIAPWYVDMKDQPGAEAEIYRPKYSGNNNFFPECYIIPLDAASQDNPAAALAMQDFLLKNGVTVHTLNKDVTVDGVTYAAGSMVVSMYQAKRNVANGALYDGVLITTWTDLYSEPITAFGKMRGFTCVAIDQVGAVTADMLTEVTVAQKAAAQLTGPVGKLTVIDNNSVEAIAMVNAMLEDGVQVGFITQGEYSADYLVSYTDYQKYAPQYAVKAVGVEKVPKAQTLKKTALYIPGFAGDFSLNAAGQPYGAVNYPNYGNTNYNFDLFAYGQQMGFTLVSDPAQADVIVGNRSLDSAALAAVKAGTPYLAAGAGTLKTVKDELLGQYGFDFVSSGSNQDALYHVTYGDASLITAGYVKQQDDLVYSYGGAYISAVPQGAKTLVTATKDTPLEGFMMQKNLDAFLGSVQAVDYQANGLDVTVFAGSLTNKAHQQDEYQFAANTIFSKTMGADFATGFADISSHWGYEAAVYAYENSLFQGVSATSFAPDTVMSKAMMTQVLYNLAAAPEGPAATFADVKADDWYAKAIGWAEAQGVLENVGAGETAFNPEAPVTREQMAVMLYNFGKLTGKDVSASGSYSTFGDGASVSPWAKEAMEYAVGAGLIGGMGDNTLAPQGNATRAQAATILQRYLES